MSVIYTGDNFHPWFDAVEDARAAVRWFVEDANAVPLKLDTSRIVAFGGSAGAVTVAQLLHALPDGVPMPPSPPSPAPSPHALVGNSGSVGVGNVTCGIALSGAMPPASITSKQVLANASSPPYLDFHGTKDTTVPYDW
jgi:predicted esterase